MLAIINRELLAYVAKTKGIKSELNTSYCILLFVFLLWLMYKLFYQFNSEDIGMNNKLLLLGLGGFILGASITSVALESLESGLAKQQSEAQAAYEAKWGGLND